MALLKNSVSSFEKERKIISSNLPSDDSVVLWPPCFLLLVCCMLDWVGFFFVPSMRKKIHIPLASALIHCNLTFLKAMDLNIWRNIVGSVCNNLTLVKQWFGLFLTGRPHIPGVMVHNVVDVVIFNSNTWKETKMHWDQGIANH